MREERLVLTSDLEYKIFKELLVIEENKKYKAILIIQFSGIHGEGSGGNKNSEFMKTIVSSALGLFFSDCLVLDLANLDYEFGDSLGNVLSLPKQIKGNEFETVLITSEKSSKGILSLIKYLEDPKIQHKVFGSLDEGILYCKKKMETIE